MRRHALWLFAVIPGLACLCASAYFALHDWPALYRAFGRWEQLAKNGGSDRALAIALAYQNSFRINVFADGVGILLGGIWMSIGVHGLCLLSGKENMKGARP